MTADPVIVPREPTEAMIDAVPVMCRARINWRAKAAEAYTAMLSAAPLVGDGQGSSSLKGDDTQPGAEGAVVAWPEITDAWVDTYCELTGRDPDGQQVTFVDGGVVTNLRDVARREIEAMLCAASKPAVRQIGEAQYVNGRLDFTHAPSLGAFIGKSLASFVSGNRMPCMSGDDRERIPEHIRTRYDRTCEGVAAGILAAISDDKQAGIGPLADEQNIQAGDGQ